MTYRYDAVLARWILAGFLVLAALPGCDTNTSPGDYTFGCDPSESGQCGEGYECQLDPSRDAHICVPSGTTFDVEEDTSDVAEDTSDTTDTADTFDTSDLEDTRDTSDIQEVVDTGCQSNAECESGTYCDTATGECLAGCGTDTDCTDGEFCSENECITEQPPCVVSDPPDRCDDSTTPQWGAASVVYEITVAGYDPGDDTFSETSCCHDFDGDGETDNGYGKILDDFGSMFDRRFPMADTIFADRISSGDLRIAFEYQGLGSLNQADDTFTTNVYQSQMSGSISQDGSSTNPLTITSLNFEPGTYYPRWLLPDGQYAVTSTSPRTSRLVSGPGRMRIFLPFLIDLEVELSGARIDAVVPSSPTSATNDDGVFLEQGKLSGYVPVLDIYEAFNDIARGCTCLGLGINEDLISYNPNDLTDTDAVSCKETNTDTCTDERCTLLGDNCGLFASVLPAMADYDADGDSNLDAMTVGLRFSAAGAFIEAASSN